MPSRNIGTAGEGPSFFFTHQGLGPSQLFNVRERGQKIVSNQSQTIDTMIWHHTCLGNRVAGSVPALQFRSEKFMNKRLLSSLLAGSLAMAAASSAHALAINVTNDPNTLLTALFATNSGITVVPGSVTFTGASFQSGTYTNLNLVPNGPGLPVSAPDGILLTSGHADNLIGTNTTNSYSNSLNQPGTGNNPLLSGLSGKSTLDQNFISFQFTVDAGFDAVSAVFAFGSDEYPTQTVTDIFGFFVDGTNYAYFPDGSLVSNIAQAGFQSNPVGSDVYGVEYNGLTVSHSVLGALDPTLSIHTLVIAIADTNDTIYDSGVFIGGLAAGVSVGPCQGIGCPPPPPPPGVPEPSALALLGLGGIAGLALRRRKQKTAP
jgi:hypothetical protein